MNRCIASTTNGIDQVFLVDRRISGNDRFYQILLNRVEATS
jgi:hypothetical protein